VQKDKSISTSVFSLSGLNSLYSLSAKEAVLMVTTLGQKSSNMLSTESHNPAGQQYSSSLLVWREHDMPLQTVTLFLC
jgi:hypothetical protein